MSVCVCVSVLVTLSPPLPPVPHPAPSPPTCASGCRQVQPILAGVSQYPSSLWRYKGHHDGGGRACRVLRAQVLSTGGESRKTQGVLYCPTPTPAAPPHPCSMGTKTPHVTSSSSTSWRGLTTECPTTPQTSSPSTSVSATTTAAAPPPAPWWCTAVRGWDGRAPLSPWIPAFR